MEKLLEVREVCFKRAGNQILDSINWRTELGEHWVVLGPNGAGKTTLAAIIAGRTYPSSGSVSILGGALGKVPVADFHQRVGLCSSALLKTIPPQQIVKNLIVSAAYGTLVGVRGQKYEEMDFTRAKDLMELFGVEELADRRIGTLSDGERQRVMIARALMADPEILVLDEPMAGVDLQARELLIAALDELATHPSSPQIVLVTHHLEEVPSSFNRVLLLRQGRVVACGDIEQLLNENNLSLSFGLPLRCGQSEDGRWWSRA